MEKFDFGDEVVCHIQGSSVQPETVVVIGTPEYSNGYDDVVMLANETGIGMPCNVAHLTKTGKHRVEEAVLYCHRYIEDVSDKLLVKENEDYGKGD